MHIFKEQHVLGNQRYAILFSSVLTISEMQVNFILYGKLLVFIYFMIPFLSSSIVLLSSAFAKSELFIKAI